MEFWGSVHRVIGTVCDLIPTSFYPAGQYQPLAAIQLFAHGGPSGYILRRSEPFVHDVLNVFMCTGFYP